VEAPGQKLGAHVTCPGEIRTRAAVEHPDTNDVQRPGSSVKSLVIDDEPDTRVVSAMG